MYGSDLYKKIQLIFVALRRYYRGSLMGFWVNLEMFVRMVFLHGNAWGNGSPKEGGFFMAPWRVDFSMGYGRVDSDCILGKVNRIPKSYLRRRGFPDYNDRYPGSLKSWHN